MNETKSHRIIIELPPSVVENIKDIAAADRTKTKPYIEKVVIAHVERKTKSKTK